jgi:hypothetical protein
VAVVEHEHVVLQVPGVGVARDDVGERRALDRVERVGTEPLVLEPEAVAVGAAATPQSAGR